LLSSPVREQARAGDRDGVRPHRCDVALTKTDTSSFGTRQVDVRALKSSPTLGNRSNHCATFSRAGSVEGVVPTAIDNSH